MKRPGPKQVSPRKARRVLSVLIPVLALGAATAITLHYWPHTPPPALPVIKPDGADPAVLRIIADTSSVVQSNLYSGSAWGKLGTVLAVHDFIAESDHCFAQAEKFEPREPRWPYLRGLALSGENLEAALPCLERAARLAPASIPAPALRYAEALIERGKLDEAEAQVRPVYKQNTNDARALLALGRIALARNSLTNSLDLLKRSSELAPDVRPTHALLASIYQRMGNTAAGEASLRRSATLTETPDWPDPYLAEANSMRRGKATAARVAELLMEQRQFDRVIQIIKPVTQVYPDFVKGWLILGKALNEQKQYAGAEEALRKALALEPGSVDVNNELGSAFFGQQKYPEAEQAYRTALNIKAGQGETWFNLGLALMNQKNNQAAVEAFQTAVRYKPDLTYAYIRSGQALGRLNRVPEAIEQLQHALRLSPDNKEALDMLEILQKFAPPPTPK